jgi:hypothetical protein
MAEISGENLTAVRRFAETTVRDFPLEPVAQG